MHEAAAKHVLPIWQTARVRAREKPDGSLVTAADLACDEFLSAQLPALLPGSVVVSEEGHPALSPDEERPIWLIDPVDGTLAFAHGSSLFAIMVALCHRGAVLRSWIYRPIGDVMLEFDGVSTTLNGARLTQPAGNAGFIGAHHSHWRIASYPLAPDLPKVTSTIFASTEAFKLALGLSEFWAIDYLTPWDLAPVAGIQRGLGGVALFDDGTEYRPGVTGRVFVCARSHEHFHAIWNRIKPLHEALPLRDGAI